VADVATVVVAAAFVRAVVGGGFGARSGPCSSPRPPGGDGLAGGLTPGTVGVAAPLSPRLALPACFARTADVVAADAIAAAVFVGTVVGASGRASA
jgi:hypothetical protein